MCSAFVEQLRAASSDTRLHDGVKPSQQQPYATDSNAKQAWTVAGAVSAQGCASVLPNLRRKLRHLAGCQEEKPHAKVRRIISRGVLGPSADGLAPAQVS